MNTPQTPPNLDDSIAVVARALPPLIRDYLAQEKYTPITRSLMTAYRLRTDQGGVLEREIMLMLAGIDTPADFTQALAEEARLDAQTINGIMQDVNAQIFMPLRAQMRNVGNVAPPPVQRAVPPPPPPLAPKVAAAPPARPSPVHVPLPNYGYAAPPLQSPRYARVENKTDYTIAALPPKMMTPRTTPTPAATAPQARVAPQMPHMEMLPVGEEVVRPVPQPAFPARPAPAAAEFPANLPGAMPPLAVPIQPRAAAPVAPAAPVAAPYSSDPYREAIEGN